MQGKIKTRALLTAACCLLTFAAQAGDRISGRPLAIRSEVLATHGMVATSVPPATPIGLDVLKKGGWAVDAAIADNAAFGLVEPVSDGVGGGPFAMVRRSAPAKDDRTAGQPAIKLSLMTRAVTLATSCARKS
jgi:gamma-glutamyltranspeptidase/glutathione hydrolase